MTDTKRIEDVIREYRHARIAWDRAYREWLIAEYGPNAPISDEKDREAQRRYALDHLDELEQVERLFTEVEAANAELLRRKVEAEEELSRARYLSKTGGQ